jgi:hypothetical protein
MLHYLSVESTSAGITTAVSTIIIALTGLLAAFAGFYKVIRPVKEIHEIVNSQRTEMRQYTEVLMAVLRSHGIEVPIDKSMEP